MGDKMEKKRKHESSMDNYVYLPIADAMKAVNSKVNLFAVVTSIRESKKSRGSDYCRTLEIIDQSFLGYTISVNFFAQDLAMLPQVKSVGDIISLHRVVMKLHNGKSYCTCDKKFSSFALFERNYSSGSNFYQASEKYHATIHDEQFLSQLRGWLPGLPPTPSTSPATQSWELRSLKVGFHFNIVGKVLYMSEFNGEKVLYVWDGTDTPPVHMELNLDLEPKQPCPLHLEALSIPMDVVSRFPHIGSVLSISCGVFSKEIPDLDIGSHWVKLSKIRFEFQAGLWHGKMQASNTIDLLPNSECIVIQRIKAYDDRLRSKMNCHPLTSFPSPSSITEIDCDPTLYATLRESLNHPKVTHELVSIVRVVAACPWKADDLRSPVTGNYRVRLTLEDPTARVHAYILGEEGVKFFQGYPPSDVLAHKMNKLLGIFDCENPTRDPPWIWCCLRSYYMDKSYQRETRKYRVYGTTLFG